MRLALPVLVAAGAAYAQCSASGTRTIQNSGDATAFANCRTFAGSIAIATSAPGPIAIDGIQTLDGNLIVTNNTNLRSISGNQLREITGTFEANDVQNLNSVSFPNLEKVDELLFNALPNLQSLGFTAQVSEATNVRIENTELQSLQGINIETADSIVIVNNRYINDVRMQLGNISTELTLEGNNADVKVAFPNLIWATALTFRDCATVDLPSLETLNSSLTLVGNAFTNFSAPNLTFVGGALAINENPNLAEVSFPLLEEVVDNLELANNTKLNKIESFPELVTIQGALDMNGNITDVSIPKLNEVSGAFNLQSKSNVESACQPFADLKDKDKIKGEFVCSGDLEVVGGEGTTPTGGSTVKPTGAASPLNVQHNALMFGLAAAFFL